MSSALERDRARGRVHQPAQQPGGRALAAAGLADDAQRLALHDVEGDAVDRLDRADLALEDDPALDREVLDEVADLDQRGRSSCRQRLARRPPDARAAERAPMARLRRREPASSAGADRPARPSPDRARGAGREQAGDRRARRRRRPARAWDRCACGPPARRGSADGSGSRSGRLMRLGGRPEIGTSSSSRGLSSRGIDFSRPQVYGCWGALKISSVLRRARRSARRT